jgi:hypothetical protein
MVYEFDEDYDEVPSTEDEHPVQILPTDRSHKAFGDGFDPRRSNPVRLTLMLSIWTGNADVTAGILCWAVRIELKSN